MLVTKYSAILAALACTAVAAPLNINLGAFSPALVVGDGEISFAGGAEGAEGATSLVSTLQGASTPGEGTAAKGQAIAPAQRAAVLSEPVRDSSPPPRGPLLPQKAYRNGLTFMNFVGGTGIASRTGRQQGAEPARLARLQAATGHREERRRRKRRKRVEGRRGVGGKLWSRPGQAPSVRRGGALGPKRQAPKMQRSPT